MTRQILTIIILFALSATMAKSQDDARKYEGPGNFFIGADLGTSISLAEHINSSELFKTHLPSVTGVLGYHFTPIWSFRLQAMFSAQIGQTGIVTDPKSDEFVNYGPDFALNPQLYRPYDFYAAVASADLMFNLTNSLRRFDSRNYFDLYLVAGAGQLYTFGFSERLKDYDPEIFFVDPNSYRHWQFKAGLEGAWHISRSCDFTAELDCFFAKNAYNGQRGSDKEFEPFVSFRLGVVYYFRNSKQRHRFANPRVLHPYWKELN